MAEATRHYVEGNRLKRSLYGSGKNVHEVCREPELPFQQSGNIIFDFLVSYLSFRDHALAKCGAPFVILLFLSVSLCIFVRSVYLSICVCLFLGHHERDKCLTDGRTIVWLRVSPQSRSTTMRKREKHLKQFLAGIPFMNN